MKEYLNIFARTFAQLAGAALITLQGLDWTIEGFNASSSKAGLALVLAAVGALVAAGWAFVSSPAASAVAKATRSGVEAILGGVGAIVVNEWADVTALERIVVPTLVAAVLAFGVTFFSYQTPAEPGP
jgi:hypothetical protein